MIFEALNSLEILNLQNNKLSHIAEDVIENLVDTLKVIDITGKILFIFDIIVGA
jgi:Leucine-rich repeat (LRR) protein